MTVRALPPTPLKQEYYEYGIRKFGKHHPWIKQITNKINRGEIVLIPPENPGAIPPQVY